jgi:hypothetical protein
LACAPVLVIAVNTDGQEQGQNMKPTRTFTVSTGDGAVTGTVTITEDKPGQTSAEGDWSFLEDTPRAHEVCDTLLKMVMRVVLAEEGKVGDWSSAKWLSAKAG